MITLAGFGERLKINLFNSNIKDTSRLNEGCGAEYVHKDRKFPTGWTAGEHTNTKWMSFDGDADRQIYYYGDENGDLQVVDGDKQFTFIMMYIHKLLK